MQPMRHVSLSLERRRCIAANAVIPLWRGAAPTVRTHRAAPEGLTPPRGAASGSMMRWAQDPIRVAALGKRRTCRARACAPLGRAHATLPRMDIQRSWFASLSALLLLAACSSGGEGDATGEEADELRAPKTFACGDTDCNRKTEYCLEMKGPGARPPPGEAYRSFTNYSCESLPSACGSKPTCACLESRSMCGGKSTTGLHQTVMMM